MTPQRPRTFLWATTCLHGTGKTALLPPSLSVSLPTVGVEVWGIVVEAHLPPHTTLNTPTHISYTLVNTSTHCLDCCVSVEQSSNFLFAGNQTSRLRLLSGMRWGIRLLLYPVICGYVQLPRISVSMMESWLSLSYLECNLHISRQTSRQIGNRQHCDC